MLRISGLFLAAYLLLNSLALPWEPESEPVLLPVLMYHEVKRQAPGKDSILPEEMESDLRYLEREGYTTVLMEDICAFVYSGKPLPEKPILLTFDDGYSNNYHYLFPLLREYGAKAVINVIGKSADEFSLLPEEGGPYVHAGWKQLLEMRDSGLVELQGHSYDLHHNDATGRGCAREWRETDLAYEQRIRGDLDRMQETLYLHSGTPASAFAYPYGFYNDSLEGMLAEMGIQATFTCDFGVNRLTSDPDCLRGMKRICRSHGAELEDLLNQAFATLK